MHLSSDRRVTDGAVPADKDELQEQGDEDEERIEQRRAAHTEMGDHQPVHQPGDMVTKSRHMSSRPGGKRLLR